MNDPLAKTSTTGYIANFNHINIVGSFDPSEKGIHVCLASGYWCLSNFLERPSHILLYWQKKHAKRH